VQLVIHHDRRAVCLLGFLYSSLSPNAIIARGYFKSGKQVSLSEDQALAQATAAGASATNLPFMPLVLWGNPG